MRAIYRDYPCKWIDLLFNLFAFDRAVKKHYPSASTPHSLQPYLQSDRGEWREWMRDKDICGKKSVREQRDVVGLKHAPAERLSHNRVRCK